MSDSPTAAQAVEQTTREEDSEGIDWEAAFDAQDLDYGHARNMQIVKALVLSGQKPDGVEEQEAITRAIENGDLEKHDGGFHIPGYEPTSEASPDSTDETHDETGITSEKQSSGSEETVEVPLEEWEGMKERLEITESRLLTALDALGELTDSKQGSQVVVDELPENARKMNSTVERQSRTISAVSNQLDDIGSVVGDKEKMTKEDRIFALQKHVVEMSRQNGGSFAMDYNAVQSFFSGKDSRISSSYASQLLSSAIDAHHAFFERKSNGGNKQIAVKLDKIEEGSFFSVKKDTTGEGA